MKLLKLPVDHKGETHYVRPELITHFREFIYMGKTYITVGLDIAHGGTGKGTTLNIPMSADEFVAFLEAEA